MCSTYASTTTTQAQTLPVGTTETSQSLPKSPDPVSGTEAGAVIKSVDTGIPRNVLRNKHTKPEADVPVTAIRTIQETTTEGACLLPSAWQIALSS